MSVGNGTKTFTVQPGLAYSSLQDVVVTYDADPIGTHMNGYIVSYNTVSGVLVIDVQQHQGSGTYTAWTINLDGAVGASGSSGSSGSSGQNGSSGSSGTNGTNGSSGSSGASGSSGSSGQSGSSGTSGISGSSGSSGQSGSSGTSGVNGTNGSSGSSGTSGINGATGPAGTSFIWQGVWSDALAYYVNDVVEYEGSSYICIQSHPFTLFPPPQNPTDWELMAEKGATGSPGLGLPARNIYNGGTAGWVGIGTTGSYLDVTFTSPFANANYSIDVQYTISNDANQYIYDWAQPGIILGDLKIENKTASGFRLVENVRNVLTFGVHYNNMWIQAIGLGESNGSGLNGSSGSSGVSGSSGSSGTSGLGLPAKVFNIGGTAGWVYNDISNWWEYDVVFTSSFPDANYGIDLQYNVDDDPTFYYDLYNTFSTPIGNVSQIGNLYITNKTASGLKVISYMNQNLNYYPEFYVQAIYTGESNGSGLNGSSGSSGTSGTSGAVGPTGNPGLIPINSQSTNYTLVLADSGKTIDMSSSSTRTVTVPTNASEPFAVGTNILIVRGGTGEVGITGDTGVTVNSAEGKRNLNYQYSAGSLLKVGTDSWYLFGDLKS